MIKTFQIKKLSGAGPAEKEDVLAVEEPLEISLKTGPDQKQSTLSVTMRTPGNDEELAVGFLFTEGIIFSKAHLGKSAQGVFGDNRITISLHPAFDVNLDKLKRNFYTTSSCGVCGKDSIDAIRQVCNVQVETKNVRVGKEILFALPEKLLEKQRTFESTGGIHASALFDLEGNLLSIREDVGRHNALDKLIGAELLRSETDSFSLGDRILLLSGRASFELIQKAAMAGIPVVCAIGAPSSLALETAAEFGITLVGFLKNGSCNVYCGGERIVSAQMAII